MTNENLKLDFGHFVEGPFLAFNEQFSGKGQSWLKRVNRDKSVEIFPGVNQHTHKYVQFLLDTHSALCEANLIYTDEAKGYCYLSSVDQCLVDWGAGPKAILPPLEDNKEIRQAKNLRDATDEDKSIAKNMLSKILECSTPRPIHFKKVSSCGFPYMASGLELKVALFYETVERLEELITLTATRKYQTRFTRFGSYPMYTNGIRIQADNVKRDETGNPVTKTRYSFSLRKEDYGKKFPVNAPVVIDGREIPELFCARWRSMYALTRHDNAILQILNNYLHHGSITVCEGLNYEGPQKTSEEIKSFFNRLRESTAVPGQFKEDPVVITLDKSEFGETFCPGILEVIIDVLASKFNPVVASFVRETLDAPTCVRGMFKDSELSFFSRDWMIKDAELSLRGSFKSGHGLVAFIGEFLGALDAALITKRVCENIGFGWSLESFLENSHPLFMYKGKGDDTLFACSSKFANELDKVLKEGTASLHSDEREKFAKFLGFFYSHSGELHTDMSRYIESETGSERGWRAKAFPALGAYMKDVLYGVNPTFNEVRKILDEKLIKHFSFNRQEWLKPYRNLGAYNENLAIFLANPEKLLYQDYLGKEVEDEYIKQIYEIIDEEYVGKVVERLKRL